MFERSYFNEVRLLILIACSMAVFTTCRDFHRNDSHPEIYDKNIIKGRKLAAVYCQSCHLLPLPEMLDTKSWEQHVLPHMGPRLGIYDYHFQKYPVVSDRNLPKEFYPSRPLVDEDDWKHILDYYIATSPDSLPAQERPVPLQTGLTLFKIETTGLRYKAPAISFAKINASAKHEHNIVIADFFKQILFRLDDKLNLVDSLFSVGAIVDINFRGDSMLTCNMAIFDPNDGRYGDARYINADSSGMIKKDSLALFGSLARPVQIVSTDINNDGRIDYVTCEFGYMTGALSWQENKAHGLFEHHIIKAVPGAVRVQIQDFNKDGLPDIWALFAQGDEGISLFTNKGKGLFEEQRLLRFPAVNGSSYFELADFNKDGYPDIIYTAGDNADFSMVLKPYHGVYIFMNDGTNHFIQKFFYPINGCYKAIARDFDNDGDLDLATIAFFADYVHQPQEGFIYFENTGDLKFKPFTIPGTEVGRWITMDAGDIDNDGKIDLVLGNFSSAPGFLKSTTDWKKGPPFIILKNTGRQVPNTGR